MNICIDWEAVSSRPQLNGIPVDIADAAINGKYDKQTRKNTLTLKPRWLENLRENVKRWDFEKHNASQLHRKGYEGKTAYIVGAGPSLSKNIHELNR